MPITAATAVSGPLIDTHLPAYDVVITEGLVIDADSDAVYRAARDLDFMTVGTPL